MPHEELPSASQSSPEKPLPFPAATRALLHEAVDAVFDEQPHADAVTLQQRLNEEMQRIFKGNDDKIIQQAIGGIRDQLMNATSHVHKKNGILGLEFSDAVLVK